MSILTDSEFDTLVEGISTIANKLGINSIELAIILNTDQKVIFENTNDVITRMDMLIRIDDALRTTYPTNPEYGAHWIKKKCTKLNGDIPLNVMMEGMNGLIRVLSHIDCTFSWDITGSRHIY